MKEQTKIISPIAIDMGAKNTGVYYAKYERDSSFEEIEKQGQVLVYDKYTPLLKDRTANRHARRGYQRKKLAKRLLVLILKHYFNFPAKQHAQAIGFLLNRRGFTFLDEAYSKEHLANFPDAAWDELGEVKNLLGDEKENIADELMRLATDSPGKITTIFTSIQKIEGYKRIKDQKKDLIYFKYVKKIAESCEQRIGSKTIEEGRKDHHKLSKTAKWIVERLIKCGVVSLSEAIQENIYNIDLLKHLNEIGKQQAESLKESLSKLTNISEKEKKTKDEVKKSIWDFDFKEFSIEDNESALTNKQHIKSRSDGYNNHDQSHLHHFCHAIYKINNEIVSGARHRSKYFEEIKEDLKKFINEDFLSNKHSPTYLKEFAEALKRNDKLDKDKLWRLICHISNFELKPLRVYFNDKTPIKRNKDYKRDNETVSNFISHTIKDGGDKYNLEKISRLASVWFLKNWRVTEDKDNKKKVEEYKELRLAWKNHEDEGGKNDVVKFWLNTCPTLTIPPYQSMNNRKPPKCQTLLLNGGYLDEHYSEWQDWLKLLTPDTEYKDAKYKEKLQDLLSGKEQRKNHDGRLISDDSIKLRQLQFILDTTKKQDKYKLNEIWSLHHKLQQLPKDSSNIEEKQEKQEWQSKLEKVKEASKLPNELKQNLDFETQGSFGHFINKYYQTRRKARDGRYFLHQDKKEKWITEDKLLTLCTHKPRQKKHQWKIDLAAVLGVDGETLKQKIGSTLKEADAFFDKMFANQYKINDLQSCCDKVAKAQKEHRGELKIKINTALIELEKAKRNNKTLKKGIDKDLANLANMCRELKDKLVEKIGIDGLLADKQSQENDQKISLVFKFAQINNIVFKERSGFSKTCPVCSTDNGFRMQEDGQGIAKASRLPALSIRLIDGLVMRICDAVSRQVANTCWKRIKDDLDNGNKVNIPLIFEQNRFEFEPSLKVMKGKLKEKGKGDNKESLVAKSEKERNKEFSDKEQRIKDAAQDICAYKGTSLGKDGEIDHIIPQASKYGTLNDEANLIYVSNLGNQDKGKKSIFLTDLHSSYKKKIFDNKTDEQIKQFIYDELEGKNKQSTDTDADSDHFTFGRYLSFINLTDNQQKAFRHALFLPDSDPLKQKVVRSLQNRNRAIVNGTQRYMAQCIADKLYKIAWGAGKAKQIEFDYFEYTARADDPKSTYNLRKLYGIDKPEKQPLYSHLIDAQMAFLIASEDHKNDGSMGIKFVENQTIWQEQVDEKSGEILPSKLFNNSEIGESAFKAIDLKPISSNKKISNIEKNNDGKKQNLSKIFKRYAFKQNAIGERYKPIVKFVDKWYLGYPRSNDDKVYNYDEYCQEIGRRDAERVEEIIFDNKYYELTTDKEQIKIWTIKKINKQYKQIDKDSHKYFGKLKLKYTEAELTEVKKIKFILEKCQYYVAKTEVINAPKVLNKEGDKKYPFYKNWVDFDKAWRDVVGANYATDNKGEKYDLTDNKVAKKWNQFCKNKFSAPGKQTKNRHRTTGKKYTMISLGTVSGTVFRVNRQGRDIYQAVPLDTNIVSKDRSNFLIKQSKNLTLVSKAADKDLLKTISIEPEFKLDNYEIEANLFFKNNDNLKNVKVYLNKNSVNIKNLPIDTFKEYLDYSNNKEEKNIHDIFNEKSATRYPVKQSKIKDNIEITPRDGNISEIKIDNDRVCFSIPFKSAAIEKFYNKIQEGDD